MSGVFMDGGGHDHGGHVGHSGGESFMDGGHGHDHGGHHGGESCIEGGIHHEGAHGIGGHVGEGGGLNLGSLFGLNNQSQHSFVAHLLGLDHDAHGGGHGLGGHVSGQSAQMPFWAAALQGLTLESLFQDMKLSPAGWMLVMFLGFISWLGMVSVVRHNEPLANAVIGTKIDNSYAAKFSTPSRLPLAPTNTSLFTAPQPAVPATPIAAVKGMPGAATASAINVFPAPVHPALSVPATSVQLSAVAPSRSLTFPPSLAPMLLNGPAVNVPTFHAGSARVKTIVNR